MSSPEVSSCVVHSPKEYLSQEGIHFFTGISAQRTGATALCMTHYIIDPGGSVSTHVHDTHEAAMFVISGTVLAWWGPVLENSASLGAGDFFFIPVGEPHRLENAHRDNPAVTIVIRSDPAEPEKIRQLPELDDRIKNRTAGTE
jgi:uncharacterized RmlC-like cupin family protein